MSGARCESYSVMKVTSVIKCLLVTVVVTGLADCVGTLFVLFLVFNYKV